METRQLVQPPLIEAGFPSILQPLRERDNFSTVDKTSNLWERDNLSTVDKTSNFWERDNLSTVDKTSNFWERDNFSTVDKTPASQCVHHTLDFCSQFRHTCSNASIRSISPLLSSTPTPQEHRGDTKEAVTMETQRRKWHNKKGLTPFLKLVSHWRVIVRRSKSLMSPLS